jgi:putative addiction module component (TIGR02574 family)
MARFVMVCCTTSALNLKPLAPQDKLREFLEDTMTKAADTLYQAALQLPEHDRAELAAKLIDSIDPTTDTDWAEAWDAEIAKRIIELEAGKTKTIPWDQVRQGIVGAKG